jgi:DNA repair photolyase
MPASSLVGIARLAHEASALEFKARVEYRELTARSLLNRCSGAGRVPFDWTINPYRGCEFGCKYCYARYTHEFMEFRQPEDFERKIFAKEFDHVAFARELRQVKPQEWIAIGTATDPYQPAERRYSRTRQVLEIFARRAGFRLALTTKSDLVARDAGLLGEVARRNKLRVTLTITTMDAELARAIEPLAPRPDLRVTAVRALSRAGVEVGVYASPAMPGLNDAAQDLEAVARAAADASARSFGANLLFLKPCALQVFMPFLEEQFPWLAEAYRGHYAKGAYLKGAHPERLERIVAGLREKYGLGSTRVGSAPEWGQMGLFADAPAEFAPVTYSGAR